MTRSLKTIIHFAAAICASMAGPVVAQDAAEPPRVSTRQGASGTELTLNEINTENYPDVAIFATILKDGEPVTGLGTGNFKVSEDEVEQSPLTVEAQLPPLSVVVTVDVSGSMSKRMDATKTAAADFVGQLGKTDAAQLVSFQREIATLTPMTMNKESVAQAVGGLVARGDTALFDGLLTSLELVAERKGRKAVVLLSDGVDDDGTGKPLSKATVQQALERAAEINAPVFVIGLGTEMDEAVLKQVAGETGGRYLPASEASQLAEVYDSIGSQLSGQYAIRYTSSLPADGSARRVDLRAAGLLVAKSYTGPGGAETALGKRQDVARGDCAVPAAIAGERANLEKANDGYKRDLLSITDRNDVRKAAARRIFAAAEATPPGSIDCARDTLSSINALYDEKLIDISDRNDLREPPTQALSGLCTADGNLETLQRCLTFYAEFYDKKLIEITTRNNLINAIARPYVEALGQLDDLDAALERANQLYEMEAISITTRNEIRDTLRDKFLMGK
ncbi:MAG: vWA domain-containing protein [Inquilinus sp.]|uniref:vWA domain-containing protein n=1 Tax=Inquilinus sp. TaxID=1932117 RepID=UPI003F34A13B